MKGVVKVFNYSEYININKYLIENYRVFGCMSSTCESWSSSIVARYVSV